MSDTNPFRGHTCMNWQLASSAWKELKNKLTADELLHALRHSPRLISQHVKELAREYMEDHPDASADEVVDYVTNVLEETDT